ncbi:ParB family protein, partial [Burkholderia multivorans]
MSFYQARADTDRLRGAVLATRLEEGHRSMSEFINNA